MTQASKNDISLIFKRLKSVPANKVCFECGSKNPKWASVTYGVFLCIECSGTHRSLGVHLTFVRSTVLDWSWTWRQLRQMQLGGNANAALFFRQHNCTTQDAQQKYKSRAAQLYRDKLHGAAERSLKLHGTTLYVDAPLNQAEEGDNEGGDEEDFFEQHEKVKEEEDESCRLSTNIPIKPTQKLENDGVGPSVDLSLSSAEHTTTRKATIGTKKNQKRVGGLGAKKIGSGLGGLGAHKVKKDFSEIEKEAELADQIKTKIENDERDVKKSAEETAKSATSMRLAYRDIAEEQKKEEEKMRKSDPNKAEQVERLGMGFKAKTGVSHSLLTDMGTITQEEPSGYQKSNRRSSGSRKYDNDFEIIDQISDEFSGFSSGGGGRSWENEFERMKLEKKTTDVDSWRNDFGTEERRPTRNAMSTSNSYSTEEASKKFGNAKGISSDMFFGNDSNGGQDANLNRFQGSSSISSAEYFNRNEVTPASRIQSPDLEDVKESVRMGVSKVAGRLSGVASGVMSQLQEKYGY